MTDIQPRKTFLFYTNWWDALSNLEDDERLAVYDAIFKYTREGETPQFVSVAARTAFNFIKGVLDSNYEKYDTQCALNAQKIRTRRKCDFPHVSDTGL